MEFNEKLQDLRKKNKITQQQLADAIYVSRTAISKWESGRGFPNIDSLKSIASYFGVTVDELLSTEEAIKIADESRKQTEDRYRTLVFGIVDLGALLLLILPFFAVRNLDQVTGGSLFVLNGMTPYIKVIFSFIVICTATIGVITLLTRNPGIAISANILRIISLALGTVSVAVFILTLQPYAAIYAFLLLIIKAFFAFDCG